MTFRMKKKPSKPKRLAIPCSTYTYYGETLSQFLNRLPTDITHNSMKWSGSQLTWTQLEPDQVYNRKLAKYEKQLAGYEKWLVDNKEAIEEVAYKKANAKKIKYEEQAKVLQDQLKKVYDKLDKI